ncbi:hypothetical protein ACHAXA_010077 [Cyclostephanos tholiformis]|uniref:Uncharacterized protein n=1 Tax=Cyclostephanos tholiformis TaxID=382380 RepID=A0ABD3R7I9_9STRA
MTSGKRFRRRYDPNDWESSILTIRHNVLCLGMSYPCVNTLLSKNNNDGQRRRNVGREVVFHSAPSVERSVELVLRNVLSQIDGRDLARLVALEADNDILAYTVSKAEGSHYGMRHLNANFNGRNFVEQMRTRWGGSVKFRQVILDYFWSPTGSWAIEHWQRSFFNENIPRFVAEDLLNFGDLDKDYHFVSARREGSGVADDYVYSTSAVIYLPFCSHCLSQVVSCYDKLSRYYAISFLRKDELEEHTLWKATNTISPASMKGWLAKAINQEDIYCTLDEKQIKSSIVDDHVTKDAVLDVFRMIPRSSEVRMIKLTALMIYHPNFAKSDYATWTTPTLGLNVGGFVFSSIKAYNKTINGLRLAKWPKKRRHSNQSLDKVGSRKRGRRYGSVVKRANSGIASQTDQPPEQSRKESTYLDNIELRWERILSSLESEYAERVNICAGFVSHVVPGNEGCAANESIAGINGPLVPSDELSMKSAIEKTAKERPTMECAHDVVDVTRQVLESDQLNSAFDTIPSVNDLVIGDNHDLHPGNVQYFDALNACGLDSSSVTDCFADALKFSDPPGRYLIRDKWSGRWAVVDDHIAKALVLHLVDNGMLNRSSDGRPNEATSSYLIRAVQRLHLDKTLLNEHESEVSELSETSNTDGTAIPRDVWRMKKLRDSSRWEPIVHIMSRNGISNNEEMSKITTDEGTSKFIASRNEQNISRRKGESSALSLAIVEFKATYKTDDNEEGEMSLAPPVANVDGRKNHEEAKQSGLTRPLSAAVSISTSPSWSSLVTELAEITVFTATASTNTISTSDTSVSFPVDSMSSASSVSPEGATLKVLAEWLQSSIGFTHENVASIKIALSQIHSDNVDRDAMLRQCCQILTQAFEVEAAALRSLCTMRE